MLSLADDVKYISDINVLTVPKYQITIALHGRNHAMVNDSSLLFGLYPSDGWKLESTRGGTAECLRYGLEKNVIIYQMNPFTLECFLVA